MTEDDFLFYEDQKAPRKDRCLHLEEPLTSSNLRLRRINTLRTGVPYIRTTR